MSLSEDLQWRGLIKDKTFTDVKWLDKPQTFYLGLDPSSDSLQVGNLAVLILAKRLIEAGWRAVILVGGATGLIGDPGGKTSERNLQSREDIQKNVTAMKSQIEKLFAGKDFKLVDNYDWLKDVTYLDFLREVGKNFSMTELMQRDFVAERMGEGASGISYAEFSYSLLQGYDYWYLNKHESVVLQIGASDQWGNMLSGVPLIRKKEGKEVQAFSMPLVIDKSTGIKFGKSEAGAIWLDARKTSPTQFYQFWINASDEDIEDYLKYYSLKSREDIEQLIEKQKADPASRIAQKALAEEITGLLHGEGQAQSSQGATKYLTGQASIADATQEEISELKQQIPAFSSDIGHSVTEALVATGLAQSNSDSRRLIEGNAIYINGEQIRRDSFEQADFKNGRLLLRRGKAYKDSALIELGEG